MIIHKTFRLSKKGATVAGRGGKSKNAIPIVEVGSTALLGTPTGASTPRKFHG